MRTVTVPETIPASKVQAFLTDLGLDINQLISLSIGTEGVHAECAVVDVDGKNYMAPNGDLATDVLSLRIDWDS